MAQGLIAVLGVGRMGEALIKGLLKSISPKNILVFDTDGQRLKYIADTYKVSATKNNQEAVKEAEIVIIAVKPQVIGPLFSQIKDGLNSGQLLISLAAGITTQRIEKDLKDIPVMRVMPNTPCLIGDGIMAICRGAKAKAKDEARVKKMLASLGQTISVPEELMDAVTGLSGSGPAYVFTVIEAMAQGGIKAGLSPQDALKLATQTVLGAAKLVLETGKSPRELRDMVTSPGGTTIEGLKKLEEGNFGKTLIAAIEAAARRSKELSQKF